MKSADEPVRRNLRSAVYHLLCCWDALNDAERASSDLDAFEISDIECIAGGLLDADDALNIEESTVQKWIEEIREERNERMMSDD